MNIHIVFKNIFFSNARPQATNRRQSIQNLCKFCHINSAFDKHLKLSAQNFDMDFLKSFN